MITPGQIKWIGIGFALLALAIGLGWVNTRLERANEADQLEADFAAYQASVRVRDLKAQEQAKADAARERQHLAKLAEAQQQLAEIAQRPVKTVVYRETISPDGTECAQPSIAPEWVQNYNDTATAASPPR